MARPNPGLIEIGQLLDGTPLSRPYSDGTAVGWHALIQALLRLDSSWMARAYPGVIEIGQQLDGTPLSMPY